MIKIRVFAAFKDYFEEEFELSGEVQSISEIKSQLLMINPDSKSLLDTARFAVNHTFVNETDLISENGHVFLIPPSGGG